MGEMATQGLGPSSYSPSNSHCPEAESSASDVNEKPQEI